MTLRALTLCARMGHPKSVPLTSPVLGDLTLHKIRHTDAVGVGNVKKRSFKSVTSICGIELTSISPVEPTHSKRER